MFDAGSAVFTLAGHVVRTGFEQYGRLVDQARAQKEHSVVLGSKVDSVGFDRFAAALTGTRQKVTEFTVATKKSFDEVAGSSDRMSKASSRGLEVVGEVVGKTAEKLGVLADTAKATADRISASQVRIDKSVGSTSEEYKVFGDEAARAYEKAGAAATVSAREQKAASEEVLASQAKAARGYRNPLGPPGGGGGGGGGAAGDTPENQAKKTTAAWKSGFNTLAGIGKWATLGILGVGALSLKAASDFQRNMTLLHTQANYATKDVQRLSKEVLDLAPKVGVGPNELAKSLYHVASAGIDASSALNVVTLSAEAAKVGMANTEDVTNAVVAVWKSAPKDIHSLNEAVGVMNDIVGQGNLHWEDLSKALTTGVVAAAKNAHIGMRDLGAALDVMTSRGIPAEQAATRLRTTLTLMASPTGKAAAALSQLGLSQNQLAQDMEKHGLSYALDDLQRHLDKTFPPGRKLTVDQERKALTDYGNTLYSAGERGKKLTNDIAKFKHGLDQSGDAAIKQSQLITSAFGGSRMGTTMALLVQNADDVRKHFHDLNKSDPAGRFQKAWKDTQKDFSVQVSQMWAGVQKLAIEIGDYLIPKVEAMVKALIHAWDWLHKHKIILDALAVLFGTLLVASITAFFARLVAGAVKSTIEIGRFAASIRKLPGIMADAARKSVEWLGKVWSALRRNKVAAEEANAATAEGGAGGAPGGGAAAGAATAAEGEVAGMIEGMITGVRGTLAPGSMENPLAVVVMASESYGVGARGAAAEEKTATSAGAEAAQAESQAAGTTAGAAEGAAATAAAAPAEAAAGAGAAEAGVAGAEVAGGAGMMAGAAGAVGGAILPAAIGLGVGSMAQGALGLKSGTAGTLGGAGIGAAIGMIGGPIGAGIGAAIGATVGPTLLKFLQGPSFGEKAVSGFSKGFGGPAASELKKSVTKLIDDGKSSADAAVRAAKYEDAGRMVASQLEAGWNQYKFQDEPTMFKQLKSEIGRLPPYAKFAASSSAIEFARELEASGRLPKGATQKMLNQVEQQFPGFTKYMGLSAKASVEAFTAALNLQRAEGNVRSTLHRISGDFPQVSAAMAAAGKTVVQQSNAAVKALQGIVKNGSGPARAQAEADLKDLRNKTLSYFQDMDKSVTANISDISKQVKNHSSQAASDADTQFKKFETSVQNAMAGGSLATDKGMRMIADVTNQIIAAFGGQKIPVPALIHQQQIMSLVGAGKTGPSAAVHATGGQLPGSEFGHSDVMTLVDPLGRARAKMAGDEAVFNRHQMPYVDMGLRMLGINGAEGLWNSVTTPHGVSVGYSRGGALRRLATGGYTGYSLPLPRSEMLPGSWSIDQGVDIPAPANTPEYAIGPGTIIGEGIQGFGPNTPILRITAGPLAGRAIYYGHAGPDTVRVNQTVRAGQRISEVGAGIVGLSTGPHIEIGYYPPGGMGAGSAMATTLKQLMGTSGVTSPPGGAGTGGGGFWQDLPVPQVSGKGAFADAARAALKTATAAANAYGAAQVGAAGPGGAVAFSGNEKNTILNAAKAYGIPPYILFGVWGMETAYGSNVATSSAGAMGNFQFIPGTAQSYGYPMTNRPNNAQFAQQASAAAHYLSDLIRQHHGDWNAALTAYSGGGYGLGQVTAKGRAAGFAGGGWLPGHQTGRHITARAAGRNPWAPIPSAVGHLPGFRPPRVRRGAGGLHIVGGSTGGGARGGSSSSSRGRSGAGKQQTRPRQTLSQTTANTLKDLGFGVFVTDQNTLGTLDSKYSQESDLFQLFDSGAGGLPLQDLNELMGIREKQFDILYKEWHTLPGAISAVQNDVNALMGHKVKGHWKKTGPRRSDKTWVPDKQVGGVVPNLTAEVTHVEDEIKTLRHDLQLDSQKIATIHHNVSASVQSLADGYANATAAYLNDIAVIQDQKYNNSQQRIVYQGQLRNLPSAKSSSSASLSVSQIVSGVMSGALPSTGAAGTNPAKKGLQNKIASLHASDVQLSHTEQALRRQLAAVKRQKDATARAYRSAGFDAAWAVSLDKYRIDDLIYRLQLKLTKLKASLKAEQDAGTADQQALQTLQNWQTGGLQGSSSIADSLESTIYNMLDLYRQGAQLPTPDRRSPTLSMLESILGDKPPKGMGLPIPTGLSQGIQNATQAYADFTAFQASRQALFQQFGSNFVGAGGSPASNSAGLGAGLQYFGAGAGPSPGAGAFSGGGYLSNHSDPGKGGTTINITNHFASGPPDPHTWSAGTTHELSAMA